jgi:hypothetical protein
MMQECARLRNPGPRKGQTSLGMTNIFLVVATVVLTPFAAVIAVARAAYDKHVPFGYEDETGFHIGPEPPS